VQLCRGDTIRRCWRWRSGTSAGRRRGHDLAELSYWQRICGQWIVTKGQRHVNSYALGLGGFSLIDNVLDVRVSLPVKLSDRLQLVDMGMGGPAGRQNWYENRMTFTDGQYHYEPLPEDAWRYFVLTYEGIPRGRNEVFQFLIAANLAEPSLASSCWFSTMEPYGRGEVCGRGGYIGGGRHDPLPDPLEEIVDDGAVERWHEAFCAFSRLDAAKHEGIGRAAQLFQRLRHMQIADDFRVLGHFMVIEMLLTHRPGKSDVGDSLTHQIRTKVPLLSARMAPRIDYSNFADADSAKAIWEALYEYRSAVAHGRHADFDDRRLRILRSPVDANRFLAQAVRRLLRYALDEPQLVDDLKEV
jgi:hypothetical protein